MSKNEPGDIAYLVNGDGLPKPSWLLSLYETMILGAVYQDSQGVITSANPAAEKLLGLTLDQMRGRTSADPCWRALREDGSELPADEHPAMVALRTAQPVRNAVMGIFEPVAHETRWFSVNSFPSFGGGPEPGHVCTLFEDISERRAAQFALESVSDAFLILDRGWHFTYVNALAEKMLSKTRVELLGQNIWTMFPETVGTESDIEYHKAMREQKTVTFEQRDPQRSSWFEARAYPSATGLSIYLQEISERKKLQREAQENTDRLTENEQRLRLALESGKFGSYDLDLTTNEFLSFSPTYRGLFGFPPGADFTRANSLLAAFPADLPVIMAALSDRCRTGTSSTVEFGVVWPDGSRHWLRSHGLALYDDGVPVRMIGVAQDVTLQRGAEAALLEASERQQRLMRDVLSSVTGGKLQLVEAEADLPPPLSEASEPISLTTTDGLGALRKQVKDAGSALGFDSRRWEGLMMGASETGMNAVVHGGGGIGHVSTDGREKIQVRVRDWGKGIDRENLPKAALQRGWSSTTSLGCGLAITLDTVDRLFLQTGPLGTTVVMEQGREEVAPGWC